MKMNIIFIRIEDIQAPEGKATSIGLLFLYIHNLQLVTPLSVFTAAKVIGSFTITLNNQSWKSLF